MSPPVSLTTPNTDHPEIKTLSIEIEPSPSLILDMVQLLKIHNRQSLALELCKIALNYFPQDMGLRLGMAMAYMDLNEKEKGRAEILSWAREIKDLSPILEMIARHFRQGGETRLSEWFTLFSNTLAKYPLEGRESAEFQPVPEKTTIKELEKTFYSIASKEELPNSSPELTKEKTEQEEKGQVASPVLSSLNDWLSQLKESKTKEMAS
jgi:hypothetical protein